MSHLWLHFSFSTTLGSSWTTNTVLFFLHYSETTHHTVLISHKIECLCTLNVFKMDTSIISHEGASRHMRPTDMIELNASQTSLLLFNVTDQFLQSNDKVRVQILWNQSNMKPFIEFCHRQLDDTSTWNTSVKKKKKLLLKGFTKALSWLCTVWGYVIIHWPVLVLIRNVLFLAVFYHSRYDAISLP